MKASELRKFNLVSTGSVICQVRSIGVYENIRLSPYPDNGWMESFDSNDIDPMPLTEEWLKRFGFHLEGTEKWKCAYNETSRTVKTYIDEYFEPRIRVTIVYDFEEKILRRIGIDECQGIQTMDIKHVHTFQNVIFALTGTELELSHSNND